jgi:hypothetical protein
VIVTIRIPDELYALYAERNAKKPQEELELALAEFAPYFPGKKRIVLEGADLKELASELEHPVSSPAELLARVKKFKQLSVPKLGITIELNEGQLLALKSQADFWNREGKASPEELVKFCKQQIQAGISKVLGG